MKYILLSVVFFQTAYASLLIEPYIGLNLRSEWKEHNAVEADEFSGTMKGGRLGIQKLGLMLGLDYRQGYWLVDNSEKLRLDMSHYAAFVGYDFPILLRVYGEYVIGGEARDQNENRLLGASGFVIGVGYKFFPYLSLNLEKGSLNYQEMELADGTNLEEREESASYYLLSLSIPFNLGM